MANFAKIVKSGSIANTRKFTRPNCLSFKNPHGTTRAQIWKMLEDLGFNSSQVIGLVEKKANYMDLRCKNRETVLRVYKKLTELMRYIKFTVIRIRQGLCCCALGSSTISDRCTF